MSEIATITTTTETITGTVIAGEETLTVTINAAARGPAGTGGGGGTDLASYVTQIETLSDYPATFPNDDVTAATDAATPGTLVKRAASSGNVTLTEVSCNGFELRGPTIYASFASADNLTANRTYQDPNADGVRAITGNTSGIPDALANGTLSGATWTFDTGAAVAFFAALVGGNESTARTELGAGAVGDDIFEAATVDAARAAQGVQKKVGTSTGASAVGSYDITGADGFTLEANTWYRLDLTALWTSTASNIQFDFITSGTFKRTGITTLVPGQAVNQLTSAAACAIASDTSINLRGSTGSNRTDAPHWAYVYFRTGTAGTGKAQFQVLAGTTLQTVSECIATLTKL